MKLGEIGLLGGTFDPVHMGHLHIAHVAMQWAQLDGVVFCPAAVSPFKQDAPPQASAEHRVKMLELALEGEPKFSLNLFEIERGGVSYTIDTVQKIPGNLRLILGEDVMAGFDKWRDWKQILKIAAPLVVCRKGSKRVDFSRFPGAERIDAPVVDVSSSDVRKNFSLGKSCQGLLPAKVLDYIHANGLY